MGFFSQDCEGCGHPALSIYVVNAINDWMVQVVAVQPDGSLNQGSYDGYGRVDGCEREDGEPIVGTDATVWHKACWNKAGKPAEYRGASRGSADQGYFFEDPTHDMEAPK